MKVFTDRRHGSTTTTAATGHLAPSSGWWRPDDCPMPFRYIQRGEIMPALDGSQTIWTLFYELDPSQKVLRRRRPQN